MNIYYKQWNRGAYLKGRKAFESGQSKAECPYNDKRKDNNRLTWSRSFIIAWEEGYDDAQKKIPLPPS